MRLHDSAKCRTSVISLHELRISFCSDWIDPMPMMRAVANTTLPYGVKTIVSLDPIMIDGTGMCGGCRVTVGGKTMFTCVDGPDFDAHQVDWDELRARKAFYFDEEKAQRESIVSGGSK